MLNTMNNEEFLLEEVDDDLSAQFSFDGFQVVRGEFFSHLREPAITFCNSRIYANTACVNKLQDAEYVQILVNSETKKIVIKPCNEDDKDSFLWRKARKDKEGFAPKYITCRVFFAKIVELMNWNANNRYKLLGKLIKSGGEFLFVFDLSSAETFERINKDGEKAKHSRTPIFPAEWKNQFGLSVEEHRRQLQINIFDGYAVFDVTDKEKRNEEVNQGCQDNQNQQSSLTL